MRGARGAALPAAASSLPKSRGSPRATQRQIVYMPFTGRRCTATYVVAPHLYKIYKNPSVSLKLMNKHAPPPRHAACLCEKWWVMYNHHLEEEEEGGGRQTDSHTATYPGLPGCLRGAAVRARAPRHVELAKGPQRPHLAVAPAAPSVGRLVSFVCVS